MSTKKSPAPKKESHKKKTVVEAAFSVLVKAKLHRKQCVDALNNADTAEATAEKHFNEQMDTFTREVKH